MAMLCRRTNDQKVEIIGDILKKVKLGESDITFEKLKYLYDLFVMRLLSRKDLETLLKFNENKIKIDTGDLNYRYVLHLFVIGLGKYLDFDFYKELHFLRFNTKKKSDLVLMKIQFLIIHHKMNLLTGNLGNPMSYNYIPHRVFQKNDLKDQDLNSEQLGLSIAYGIPINSKKLQFFDFHKTNLIERLNKKRYRKGYTQKQLILFDENIMVKERIASKRNCFSKINFTDFSFSPLKYV